MRNLPKLSPPHILEANKDSWNAAVALNPSETNKLRYRHPEIKERLLEETYSKCVYCESKIGHNCPGDIEHKVPKSIEISLIFDWDNMTIACTECNRRKRTYYDRGCMFLDPNTDDVESRVQHVGPLVFNKPGDKQSEVTIRMLEMSNIQARKELIARKIEKLENVRNLVERIVCEKNQVIKNFLVEELKTTCLLSSEFSGMVMSYIDDLPDDLVIEI